MKLLAGPCTLVSIARFHPITIKDMDNINLRKSIKMQLKCNKMHCLVDFIDIELLFLLFSYQTSN